MALSFVASGKRKELIKIGITNRFASFNFLLDLASFMAAQPVQLREDLKHNAYSCAKIIMHSLPSLAICR